MTAFSPGVHFRHYDYLLKFLLVGDSDVGKNEILDLLDDEDTEPSFCSLLTVAPKTTTILLEGKRVKLQLWDTSGQGRFSTIIRSYSRGAQGILVVYDITNRWSFDGIGRWLKEIDEQAPGIPKILIGNRLHLEFCRQVTRQDAEHFATKRQMEYFEVSPLAEFNIRESFTELSRLVLSRNGMERLWRNKVLSLQEACCRCIVRHLGGTVHDVDRLPLPSALQLRIKSFADTAQLTARTAMINTSTLRRRTIGFLHKRTGSDLVSGRRTVNGQCAGHLTLPSGSSLMPPERFAYQHQRSLSAVMSPLINKFQKHCNISEPSTSSAALPPAVNCAVSSTTTSDQSQVDARLQKDCRLM